MKRAVLLLALSLPLTPATSRFDAMPTQRKFDLIEQGRETVATKIKEEIADAEGQKVVIDLVNDVFDVVEATIEDGQINGGAVITGDGPFSVVIGAKVVGNANAGLS